MQCVRSRILVIPSVPDLESFSRLIAHVGHYFGHVGPERIVVFVESSVLRDAETWLRSPSLPPAFGDRVVPRIEAIRENIALTSWPTNLEPLALASDLVLDWDMERSALEPWASARSGYRPQRTLFNVGWRGTRFGAASIAEAARVVGQGRQFDQVQARGIGDLVARIGPADVAYLVGTGPSARTALERDLSDGVRIVCNTIVLDGELMDHVRPQVLTFADPIFHFGPSTYAQRFQRAVVEQAKRHDFTVVTTERDAPLLRAHAPEIADRVIGLRLGPAKWPDNFDLVAHPAVRATANVLTMLMLPLAATLARSIGLIGFDGRDPDDDYFWRHGPTVQLEEELAEIRLVHPGFFELDYADYYGEHVVALERQCAELEARGLEIRLMSRSSIPALRRRSIPRPGPSVASGSPSPPTLVSLTPDWSGDFGHFGPFERRVHEVAEAAGHSHVALASAGLQPTEAWQVPTFSEVTLFPSGDRFGPVGQRFEAELRGALDRLRPGAPSTVFLYAGDVWHLGAVLAVAADHPGVRFVVNLMRSHGWLAKAIDDADPWVEDLVELLRACLAAAVGTTVTVAVDTEALAHDVERLTGHAVPLWPMIAVSAPPQRAVAESAADRVPHVVAPVHAAHVRGYPELVGLAERWSERLRNGELRLTGRWPAAGASAEIVRLAEQLERHGGNLIRDNLTDAEFADLIASADVVLVPYRASAFRTRTSAVTIDALLAGKPVVAPRGTWAGDLVDRHRAGLTYPDGDMAAMEGAISRVLTQLDAYRRRVAEVLNAVQAEHAPERLIEFLGVEPRPATSEPRADLGQDLGQMTSRLRRHFQWRQASESLARMSAAIRDDDQHRTAEILKDRVVRLERAVAWRDRATATRSA